MDGTDEKLKTFCPLPWNHLSADSSGSGRICCDGFEMLKTNQGQAAFWKESKSLRSYFNSEDYKKIRLEMLNGERPSHCVHCFNQEDHGVRSMRRQFIDKYQSDIQKIINNTNEDGSINNPEIVYIDMALGNKCNLKCRMCSPWSSYIIGKDWQKMGQSYNEAGAKGILEDKWYALSNTFQMIKEALPHVQTIFTTGGEPMLIRDHFKILEMIIEEGHAGHILLRYNSNQTFIPNKIVDLWKHFKTVAFNCSIEGHGELNDYIRYPSKWQSLEKNIYFLDNLSSEYKHIEIYIHTTLQAYNIFKIPELLSYLRCADFRSLHRFPFFIWVKKPEWLSPSLFPKEMRAEIADRILESLNEHEEFFLNYNGDHQSWTLTRIQILKEFCEMIRNDSTQEKYLNQFIEETKKYDSLRTQSVLNVLPELKLYFN